MNRKMILLPTAVLLAALMVTSMFGATVQAQENYYSGERPPEYNPLCVYFACAPLYLSVNDPSLYSPGYVWQSGDMIYIREVVFTAYYEISDHRGNTVPGIAIVTIYSDVNLETSEASTYVSIILDNDYGWWQGEADVMAEWVNDELYIYSGDCMLYGQSGCWGWNIAVTVNFDDDDFDMSGEMYNPICEVWCPIFAVPSQPS